MARERIFPKNRGDQIFFTIFIIGIPFALFWLLYVVLPYNHDNYSDAFWHIVAGCFIVYNILGNMWSVIKIDASGDKSLLPTILKPGWKYCSVCELNCPPRAYHCYDCEECILKRDHHCRFAGCCVGYHNQRFFVMALSYICLGALYGIIYEWDYVVQAVNVPGRYLPFILFIPHFCWFFGIIPLWGMVVATLHTLAIATFLNTLYLLTLEFRSFLRGQTQYEMKHSIKDYDLSLIENIVDVFGSNWHLVWISPHINSPLNGNGIDFIKSRVFEDAKDM